MRNLKIAQLWGLFLLITSLSCVGLRQTSTTPVLPAGSPIPSATAPLPPPVVPTPPASLLNIESQVEAVYQAVRDSVVNITVSSTGFDLFMNPVTQEGSGSGFIYDDQGHIVTNFHVVENADRVLVNLADGTPLEATVVGVDSTNDLAVIKVDPENHRLTPIPLTDSQNLRVGQFVVAIGSPFGLQQTVTFGIISSLNRVIDSPDGRYIGEAIQTDAAINPGNSGGPLLDLQGQLIGVNAQIVSTSQANAGIGFAIPANTVRRVVPELITYGHYRHPWMGLRFFSAGLTPEIASELEEYGAENVPERGILVLSVEPRSAADRAGLRGGRDNIQIGRAVLPVGGDVIIAVNGIPMDEPSELIAYLETNTRVDQTIQITILRDGEEQTLPLTLQERPEQ